MQRRRHEFEALEEGGPDDPERHGERHGGGADRGHDEAHDLEEDSERHDQGVGTAPVLQDLAFGVAPAGEVAMDTVTIAGPEATPPADSVESGRPKQRKPRPALLPGVREHQIEMLEAVFQRTFEEAQPQWERVLKEMGLELCYYIPARLVIDTIPWREKACPYGYVATVTRRKAKRLGLADGELQGQQLPKIGNRSTEETIDYLEYDLLKCKGGDWKVRESYHDADDNGPVGNVSVEWVRPNGDPGEDVDWQRVAQAGGLDEIEATVLLLRSMGVSRTDLLDSCEDAQEKLEYQAAYRRLSRKMPRIRELLGNQKKNSNRSVPDLRLAGT